MKKIYLLFLTILLIFSACNSNDMKKSPDTISSINSEIIISSTPEASIIDKSHDEIVTRDKLSSEDISLLDEYFDLYLGIFSPRLFGTVDDPNYDYREYTDTSLIDKESVLYFCLLWIYIENEQLGLYDFAIIDDYNCQIPAALVSEMAKKLFNLIDFECYESKLYNSETDMYSYGIAHGFDIIKVKIISREYDVDNLVIYNVQYFEPDSIDEPPICQIEYLFKLLFEPTGKAYLQSVAAKRVPVID